MYLEVSAFFSLNLIIFIFLFLKDNYYNQLGIESDENKNSPVLLMNDTAIKEICAGYFHSMILKENGELFVFGSDYSVTFLTNLFFTFLKYLPAIFLGRANSE